MRSSGLRVSVVGGGVIGLTVAYELARAGHRVRVLAEQAAPDVVSGVAGAIWFPYAIDSSPATIAQLRAGLDRFTALAQQPGTGVDLREGLLLERLPDTPRDWMDVITHHPEAAADELPPGATAGFRLTLPLIDTPHYLTWLTGLVADAGVVQEHRRVHDLAEVARDSDAVVVAAGLGSGALLGDDDTTFPVRGQVVRLANPGSPGARLRRWLVDDDHPEGMTYVLPRSTDIVCGGTADAGTDDLTWDADVEAAILRRCIDVVPELAGLPIASRGIGLRPARPTVRLETVEGWPVPVIACYGHGGAGITASWGSAAAVAALLT